jgi:hypothetical protein
MKKNITSVILAVFLPLLIVQSAAAQAVAPNSPVGANTSLNWSGYVASSGTFTSVGASWAIPEASSSNSQLSADATWVGIGGLSSHDLIQAGTQNVFQNGTLTTEAWYELLPDVLTPISLTVHQGDQMTVSIAQQSSGQWRISFVDSTTGQNYQTVVSYNSLLSSAEWIQEMPSAETGLVPLDNFGTLSFTNGYAVQNGTQVNINNSGAQPITMIASNNQAFASPSALGSDGASFSITRSSLVASTVPVMTRRGPWSRTGVGVQGYAPRTTRVTVVTGSGIGTAAGTGNGFVVNGMGGFPFRRLSFFFRGFNGNSMSQLQLLERLEYGMR